MNNKTKALIAGVALSAAAAAGGVGIAAASGDEGVEDSRPDQAISGSALDQASAAALAETGQGRVSDTEVDDEESYYEVEVTLDDGSQVDVQLDENFDVVGTEADEESGADQD